MLCVKDECFVDHKTDKLEKDNSANKLKWSCNVRLLDGARVAFPSCPVLVSVLCRVSVTCLILAPLGAKACQ